MRRKTISGGGPEATLLLNGGGGRVSSGASVRAGSVVGPTGVSEHPFSGIENLPLMRADRKRRPWSDENYWDQQYEQALNHLNPNNHSDADPNQANAPASANNHAAYAPAPANPNPGPIANANQYPFSLQGNATRLLEMLNHPLFDSLPPNRRYVFQNLWRAMDASGLSHFKQEYPSSTGGVRGGRATFRDTNGKGNAFLTCHEAARAYVYGAYYDEIDISRSHFTHLMGCWSRTGQPRPTTVLRYISEQEALEKDIERELQAARPDLELELNQSLHAAAGVPTQSQQISIDITRQWIEKTHMQAKHIYSAVINIHNPHSWQHVFRGCDTISQLISDIKKMCPALSMHPLCSTFARALSQANTGTVRIASLCLGHLDQQVLDAAAYALNAASVSTGLTINDSLCIRRAARPIFQPSEIQAIAEHAARLRVGYQIHFKYLKLLRKPDTPPPTIMSVFAELLEAPPPQAQQPDNPAPLPASPPQPANPAPHPAPQPPPGPNPNLSPLAGGDDPWRDLAGDARTVQTETENNPPQCILASLRNLSRRALLTEHDLISRFCRKHGPQANAQPTIYDIDYCAALDDLVCTDDETARLLPTVGPRAIILTPTVTNDISNALCLIQGRRGWATHVVALIREPNSTPPRFRLYDNDSQARRNGTYTLVPSTYFAQHAQVLYVATPRNSSLAQTLPPPQARYRGGGGSSSTIPRRDSNLESQVSC